MKYFPVLKNDDLIQLGIFNIYTKVIRCFSSAAVIISLWKDLEKEGFPLDDISSTLEALDGFQYLRTKEVNILPFPIHVVRLVDAIGTCGSINGFERRKNEIKRRLCNIIKDSRIINIPRRLDGKWDLGFYWNYVDELMVTLLSGITEFRIAYMLKIVDESLEFTTEGDAKYPDFRFKGYNTSLIKPSLVEVKARLNRSYAGEEIRKVLADNKIVRTNETGLIALICRDAFTKFEQAFDRQEADIAIVDLSHSQYGDILAANSLESGSEFSLESAFAKGHQILVNGKKAVILCSEVLTPNPQDSLDIAAVAVDRDKAENLGSRLDKLEKSHYNNFNVYLDYFGLVRTANSM